MSLSAAILILTVAGSSMNAVAPVTLEVTRADGRREDVPAQNRALCEDAIAAWKAGFWLRDPDVVAVRCVDRDSFAPGWNRGAPR